MSASEELLEKETKEYRVFEYVTDALEYVDKYEKSKDEKLLQRAGEHLKKALEIDRNYFKARYFQAMVYYFQRNTKDASKQFNKLLEEFKLNKPLANEISYNLAATYSEAGDWPQAIILFKNTISNTRDNLELNLLARVGLVKTHADAKYSDNAKSVAEVISAKEIKAQYDEIRRILSPTPFRRLWRFILRKKRIDKKVRKKVEELIDDAATKEGVRFQASRLPLWILLGILLVLIAAIIFVSYGVRLQ